jgi:hypothetical protein
MKSMFCAESVISVVKVFFFLFFDLSEQRHLLHGSYMIGCRYLIFPHKSSVEEVADPVRCLRPCSSSHAFRRQINVSILKYAFSMQVHLWTHVNILFLHEHIPHIFFFLAQALIPYESIGTEVNLWACLWFEFCLSLWSGHIA